MSSAMNTLGSKKQTSVISLAIKAIAIAAVAFMLYGVVNTATQEIHEFTNQMET